MIFLSNNGITGNVIREFYNGSNSLFLIITLVSCFLISMGFLSNNDFLLDSEAKNTHKSYQKSRDLQRRYIATTDSLDSKLNTEHSKLSTKRKELNRMSALSRVGYRFGEFFRKQNPEKTLRSSIETHSRNVKDYDRLIKHRKARAEKHETLLGQKIQNEYDQIMGSPSGREASRYFDFKPSTIGEKAEYIQSLREFSQFYSELERKLKDLPKVDSQKIRFSIFNKYFSKKRTQTLPFSIPRVEEVNRIIAETRRSYREPQKKPDSNGYTVSPENLVLVHKTNHLPNQQRIKTTSNATTTKEDHLSGNPLPARSLRQTIHFTLNHPVASHIYGNWEDKKYAILIPSEHLFDKNLIAVQPSDSYAFGDVPLKNSGAEIIITREPQRLSKQQIRELRKRSDESLDENINRKTNGGTYKVMSTRELNRMKRRTGAEIVTITHATEGLDDAIRRRISERGYLVLDSNQYGDIPENEELSREIGRAHV